MDKYVGFNERCGKMDEQDRRSGRLSQKDEKRLLNGLLKMKEDTEKMEEARLKQEMKRWSQINPDCSLVEALSSLIKFDLDTIRGNLQIKKISSLKKQQLIERLAVEIPERLVALAAVILDEERIKWLKKIAKTGYLYNAKMPGEILSYFRERGLLFTGVHHGKLVIVMPAEVAAAVGRIQGERQHSFVRRNTEWIYLTQGLLYYYGVLSFIKLKGMLEGLQGVSLDVGAYSNVLSEAKACYSRIRYTLSGYCDERVDDAEKVVAEQKRRDDIPYYSFSKEELLKAGKYDFIERYPAMEAFIDFMHDSYELSQGEADELAQACVELINNDQGIAGLFDYLQARFEFPNMEFTKELANYIAVLHNQTRLWILKGHRPEDIRKAEQASFSPLPAGPVRQETPVFNIRTGEKIGRNDPCPCNSGKKFKKCCGK
jgi:hypothetical protein